MKVLVDPLPTTSAPLVPEPAEAAPAVAGPVREVAEPLDTRLAAILASVIQRADVPVDAHFFEDLGADSLVMAKFCARVRKQPDLPSVSMKEVYQHPSIADLAEVLAAPPATSVQDRLRGVLAEVLDAERVPVEADFFKDLGADSLVMAKFCARVRKQEGLPSVSMKDVYGHSSIASLAVALERAQPSVPPATGPQLPEADAGPEVAAASDARTWEYVTCGALQLLVYLGYTFVFSAILASVYRWILPAAREGGHGLAAQGLSPLEIYLRSALLGGVVFVTLCVLPIVAKWVLVGRWKPQVIRIWSLAYFRFWLVKVLMRTSPLSLMTGSPLVVLYLRAMGARVGRNVTILTNHLPVCTDLLTIGEGTLVRKDVFANGYRAHGGVIQVGAVTLGRDVVIGEASVLDIDTSLGDGSQLGHRSSLHAGQSVPAGERWHGSPARRTEVDYRTVEPVTYRPWRRVTFALGELLVLLGFWTPLGIAFFLVVLSLPRVVALLGPSMPAYTSWVFYADALAYGAVVLVSGLVLSFTLATTVPRLLRLAIAPDTTYPLYTARHAVHRTVSRLTNNRLMVELFGDSSYIVGYLRAIGYDLGRVQQTGSNFGSLMKHDTPYLTSVGTGTMVADGLSVVNTDYSATSFRVSRVAIGAHNFLGNHIVYPAGARTGDNCLLATKVLVPIDGPVRHDVGLLGSPAFEIPRSVYRDTAQQQGLTRHEFVADLAAKNRHNLHTMGLMLLTRWLILSVGMLVLLAGLERFDAHGFLSIAVSFAVMVVVGFLLPVAVERVLTASGRMAPQVCSIYDPYFWWHERYWKLQAHPLMLGLCNGTPFKPLVWRALGVRIGSRVFDDGGGIIERPLVTIGSRCTLNAGSLIQSHSQEDGAFKCDRNVIGDDVTLGVGSLVHYGAVVGDGAVIETDSFLMKGEVVTHGSVWGGNPARELRTPAPPSAPLERVTR